MVFTLHWMPFLASFPTQSIVFCTPVTVTTLMLPSSPGYRILGCDSCFLFAWCPLSLSVSSLTLWVFSHHVTNLQRGGRMLKQDLLLSQFWRLHYRLGLLLPFSSGTIFKPSRWIFFQVLLVFGWIRSLLGPPWQWVGGWQSISSRLLSPVHLTLPHGLLYAELESNHYNLLTLPCTTVWFLYFKGSLLFLRYLTLTASRKSV